jgi:hypothetical protein
MKRFEVFNYSRRNKMKKIIREDFWRGFINRIKHSKIACLTALAVAGAVTLTTAQGDFN